MQPCHQQAWYGQCRINGLFYYKIQESSNVRHLIGGKEYHIILMFTEINSARKGLKWGRCQNLCELLSLRRLKISTLYEIYIFQHVDKLFCTEFQSIHLKFRIKYLIHTLKDRADSRFAPSQWKTSLQINAVPHWLGANLDQPWKIWFNGNMDIFYTSDWKCQDYVYIK